MEKIKRFFSTTMVYFTGNVLSKLVVFFLLPLYTAKINPEQYGVYDLVIAFVNLIAPIIFIQIWDGMFRVSFDYPDNKDKYKIISNSLLVCLLGGIVYTAIFAIVQHLLYIEYAVYVFLYGLLYSIYYMYGYICRVFLDNKLYVVSGLVNTLLTAIINVILILAFNWDVKSLYLAPAIGMFVQILIVELKYKAIKNFKFNYINKNEITKMIKFSAPLCLAAISYWLLNGFSKVLITNILGASENGLFAIATRFSSMVVLIMTVFQYAWNELAYLMSNDENRVKIYNTCIDLLFKFVILGSAGVCIVIKLIFPYIINEQYSLALYIIPATIIGSMMNSMSDFIGTLFMTEKKTNNIMYSTMIAAAINIVLGIVLTKAFELHGATIALLIAFTLLMIIRLIKAKKQFNIDYKLQNSLWLVCVLIIAVIEYYLVQNIAVDICALLVIGGLFLLSVRKYINVIWTSVLKNKLVSRGKNGTI